MFLSLITFISFNTRCKALGSLGDNLDGKVEECNIKDNYNFSGARKKVRYYKFGGNYKEIKKNLIEKIFGMKIEKYDMKIEIYKKDRNNDGRPDLIKMIEIFNFPYWEHNVVAIACDSNYDGFSDIVFWDFHDEKGNQNADGIFDRIHYKRYEMKKFPGW